MKLKIYQIDAFATQVFQGNPAAVCPLNAWLDDEVLQKIAEENNLSETAFFVQSGDEIQLRWFTPAEEVDLCGHATLACAHVLYEHLAYSKPQIIFQTRSGKLVVTKEYSGFSMDFPATAPVEIKANIPSALLDGLGDMKPQKIMAAFDYIIVLNNEDEVKRLSPDFSKWLNIDLRGVIVTAAGKDAAFVSRCFFPKLRVNEDPVTGSAHCELTPYWAAVLQKNTLSARQVSSRSGFIDCELNKDRVMLTGHAVDYMIGEISI
ncbi:MAG: PhzF family phenazine biosynthesis protein [Colwellia sp.]|nr:PhzF family phenazine biosynthesis protein [Colwellia sp.]MCW8864604.1 PhzF family phenazine biosynthesis protein [Colwellia sp.]MCW9081530.1 PhzF family phenazine biosynthesis protein [Colwellia sp.]